MKIFKVQKTMKIFYFLIGGNFMNDTLYLVIPCYNEEEVLPITAKKLLLKINTMIENEIISKNSKILFVNDGSKEQPP